MIINIDEDLRNADWTKVGYWDLFITDKSGDPKLLETVDDLLKHLEVDRYVESRQKAAVEEFMKLPASEAMPKKLKKELIDRDLL